MFVINKINKNIDEKFLIINNYNIIFNYNIISNINLKIKYNNVIKFKYISKLRKQHIKFVSSNKLDKLNQNLYKYIFYNDKIIKYNTISNYFHNNINNIIYDKIILLIITIINIFNINNKKINSFFIYTNKELNYKSFINEKSFIIQYVHNFTKNINIHNENDKHIYYETNRYHKEHLLELKKNNNYYVNNFFSFNIDNLIDKKYLNEPLTNLFTVYNFLLSCIFCNKNANCSYLLSIGITKLSYQIIFFISTFFNKLVITNVKYSPSSSHILLIGTGFKGISDSEFNKLLDVYDKWSKIQPNFGARLNIHDKKIRDQFYITKPIKSTDTTDFIESIFENELPESFVNKINNFISFLLDKQKKYIEFKQWFNSQTISEKELEDIQIKIAISFFTYYNIPIDPYYSTQLYKMFSTNTIDYKKGQLVRIKINVKREECEYLYDLVTINKFTKCLEIGMDVGIISIFLCKAVQLTNGLLYSIDPYQKEKWKNIGLNNITKEKLDKYHIFKSKETYQELVNLIKKFKYKFELIVFNIDESSDMIISNIYFCDLLLKKGGYIVLLNALSSNIINVTSIINNHYYNFKKLNINIKKISVFKKLKIYKRTLL